MQAFGRIKRIVTASADAIILYFDGANLDDANYACHCMLAAIDSKKKSNSWRWLRECVPSYDSLLIIFDMALIDSHGVYRALSNLSTEDIYQQSDSSHAKGTKVVQ
jgi:allophanate hydrolase subunit 1